MDEVKTPIDYIVLRFQNEGRNNKRIGKISSLPVIMSNDNMILLKSVKPE